jgi:plasmid stabilization system protein ParE
MKSHQGFDLHPAAVQDITEIWEFIANDDPAAATRFREEILQAIRKLAELPHLGHKRADLTACPLRFQLVRDYLVAYALDQYPVVVIAVIHGRRNPRIMAAALRSRE